MSTNTSNPSPSSEVPTHPAGPSQQVTEVPVDGHDKERPEPNSSNNDKETTQQQQQPPAPPESSGGVEVGEEEGRKRRIDPIPSVGKPAKQKKSSDPKPTGKFGKIEGVHVGQIFSSRKVLSMYNVHKPLMAGVHGNKVHGCFSIVMSGGYEDDEDRGDEIVYTGSGACDKNGVITGNQSFTRHNLGITVNCVAYEHKCKKAGPGEHACEECLKRWRYGRPIRVIRGDRLKSPYAPKVGYRYDGIYRVVDYWAQKGKSGYTVCKFLLRRDDTEDSPWTLNGLKRTRELKLETLEGLRDAKIVTADPSDDARPPPSKKANVVSTQKVKPFRKPAAKSAPKGPRHVTAAAISGSENNDDEKRTLQSNRDGLVEGAWKKEFRKFFNMYSVTNTLEVKYVEDIITDLDKATLESRFVSKLRAHLSCQVKMKFICAVIIVMLCLMFAWYFYLFIVCLLYV